MSFHCSRSSGGVSSLFSCFISGARFWPSSSSSSPKSSRGHCFVLSTVGGGTGEEGGTTAGAVCGPNGDVVVEDDALRTVSGEEDNEDDVEDVDSSNDE